MDVKTMLKNAADRYGVDQNLVLAVARQESGYNPYIVSPAGAVGVMQLMPNTAEGLGVDPWDPGENIDGGVRYLKAKLEEFGGNVESALAAYNAGSEAVRKYKGVPPYKETQNYVTNIKEALGGNFDNLTSSTEGPPTPADAPYWKRWLYYQKLLFSGRWKEAESYRAAWPVEYTDTTTGEKKTVTEENISREAEQKTREGNAWAEGKVQQGFILAAGLALGITGLVVMAREGVIN